MTDTKAQAELGLDRPLAEAVNHYVALTAAEAQDGPMTDVIPEGEAQLVLFKGAQIRKVMHNDEWWFAVVDVVGALSESTNARRYWSDLKRQLFEKERFSELYDKIVQLKMPAEDGKERETDAANVETLLRIMQSVKSPRAEPFKRWLATVGYERIQETQNPEIAIKRAIATYQIQGRSDDWIEKRIRTIVTRKELTTEWKKRGIEAGKEYAVLTNVISMTTFNGVDVEGHKRFKGLRKKDQLRDHMTDLELIFTMLGEKSTTEIAKTRDAQGFAQNRAAARAGGGVAGAARAQLEKETGTRVVSASNFLVDRRVADPVLLSAPPKSKKGR